VSVGHPTVAVPTLPTPRPQAPHSHLPLQFTHFFGREEELEVLGGWCTGNPDDPTHHLITLTGPGGTGKTRLAIEAAGRVAEAFRGGVWFVPLQDLSDPRQIPGTVLDALRLPRLPQSEPLPQVVEFLNCRASAALLLLDNMEHLLETERRKAEDGAAVVRVLLERCPFLTCLVTSRQRLDLEGERELFVHPLPTPEFRPQRHRDAEAAQRASGIPTSTPRYPTPEHLMQFASVRLFADRAQSSKPDFQVTMGNAAAIAQLCDQLEGIPLALELAASRAQVMTPSQMLSQLEHRFDFLVSRRRDATERHRTLQAATEWSYRLLSSELRRFFARLSVFRGGWTVEAAEAVCEEPSALEYLGQLRECSLVVAEEREEAMRFRMLETLREFGQEQLTPEEQQTARQRHLDFFLALAEQAERELHGPQEGTWFDRLETEHDNLRTALRHAGEASSHRAQEESAGPAALVPSPSLGLRLSGALWGFWLVRGHWSEGRRWLEGALASSADGQRSVECVKALIGMGVLVKCQGEHATARAYLEESVGLARAANDTRLLAEAPDKLGHMLNGLPMERAQALQAFEESLSLREELGDRAGIAASLNALGCTSGHDWERRERLFLENLRLRREIGDRRGAAQTLEHLGGVALMKGDYVQATVLLCAIGGRGVAFRRRQVRRKRRGEPVYPAGER
jgi:non-specific serine/threonine protein kinase